VAAATARGAAQEMAHAAATARVARCPCQPVSLTLRSSTARRLSPICWR
jgi:hypothetical protein